MLRNIPEFMLNINSTRAPTKLLLKQCFYGIESNETASANKPRLLVGNHSQNPSFYTGAQQDPTEFFNILVR